MKDQKVVELLKLTEQKFESFTFDEVVMNDIAILEQKRDKRRSIVFFLASLVLAVGLVLLLSFYSGARVPDGELLVASLKEYFVMLLLAIVSLLLLFQMNMLLTNHKSYALE